MTTFLIIISIVMYLAGAYNWYQMSVMLGADSDMVGKFFIWIATIFWFLLAIFTFFMNTSYYIVQYFKKIK